MSKCRFCNGGGTLTKSDPPGQIPEYGVQARICYGCGGTGKEKYVTEPWDMGPPEKPDFLASCPEPLRTGVSKAIAKLKVDREVGRQENDAIVVAKEGCNTACVIVRLEGGGPVKIYTKEMLTVGLRDIPGAKN